MIKSRRSEMLVDKIRTGEPRVIRAIKEPRLKWVSWMEARWRLQR